MADFPISSDDHAYLPSAPRTTKLKLSTSPSELLRHRLSSDAMHQISPSTVIGTGGVSELHVHAPKARRQLPHWVYSDDGYASESSDRPASPTGSVGSVTSAVGTLGRTRYASFSSLVTPTVPTSGSSANSPARRLIKHALTFAPTSISAYPTLASLSRPLHSPTTFIIAISIFVRLVISLAPHSGMATPPMYGDFEAQRHWMELTLRLPFSQWYYYQLEWWGMDYPPLTAYVSWFWGWVGERVMGGTEGGWFALDTSRGREVEHLKVFMRWTVVLSDALVYIPAMVWWMKLWIKSSRAKHTALLLTLLQPSLLLVDFGHFQYNSVMLGFTLLAMCCFMTSRDVLGCVFFVLALSFKQMALYFAPAIGSYLLAKCIYTRSFTSFLKFGIVTSLTFTLIFLPFIPGSLPQVVHRIFPLARGLFEDKVANFWCATDVVVKWRRRVSRDGLFLLSSALTFLFFSPAPLVFLWPRKQSPISPRVLPYALLTSSLAFFLFSFQVHEKTFLLPMMALIAAIPPTPASLPIQDASTFSWNLFSEDTHGMFILANNIACFSMWPLLKRDELGLQYITIILVWNYLAHRPTPSRTLFGVLSKTVHATMLLLHVLEALFAPPARYPDLWPVLGVLVCMPVIAGLWVWSVVKMWEESWAGSGFGFGSSDLKPDVVMTVPVPVPVTRRRDGSLRGSPVRSRKASSRAMSMSFADGAMRARSPLGAVHAS